VKFSPRYQALLDHRVSLNRQIMLNAYWYLPVADADKHRLLTPVGRGEKTRESCGQFRGLSICRDLDAHKGAKVKGVDVTGKYVAVLRHLWCHKASCPVCFVRGWAVRQAGVMTARVEVGASRGLGKAEHITVSVAAADRELPEEALRRKCASALLDRGVYGFGMIFHAFRISRDGRELVYSPHYHALGFSTFDRCRDCVHNVADCQVCDGVKGRVVRGNAIDGYVVKFHGERKSLFGTAFYQLNHASIVTGGREFKRFHVTSWWGALAKRAFSSAHMVKLSVPVCPACGNERMERGFYKGEIVKDVGDVRYVPWFAASPDCFFFPERSKPDNVPREPLRRHFLRGDRGGGYARS